MTEIDENAMTVSTLKEDWGRKDIEMEESWEEELKHNFKETFWWIGSQINVWPKNKINIHLSIKISIKS